MKVYVKGYDEQGLPTGFVDEAGRDLEDIDWGPMSVLSRREVPVGCELHQAGYYACEKMGVVVREGTEDTK